MTNYDWALLLHLVAVIAFFSGMAIATAAQVGAWRRERSGEVAAVLALARLGVLVVAVGLVLVLVSGLWLVEETRRSLGDGWISTSLLLLVVSLLLGAVGGRKAKLARRLAERQASEAPVGPEVQALLRDRAALAANVLAAAATLAVLVLMVWPRTSASALVHVLAGLARPDHAPRVPGDPEDHDGDDEADDGIDDLCAEADRDRAHHHPE